ncbi:Elongator subunit ELP4 NDAI_0C05750 [Naumovozyma dairenensis CBS 421]|uniref:Elongator complex protein 4 n=1 Tax=Naumovozyma dairenensis (strain ATCC 10597 / BCRC 20456 / CBS 421 / NBRC 0211 / NRRL Y-12639) TaxID=1071378 RepID=G0W8X3_NAUDC|nr:hypothetical protein NDAI_0C05750 [Naumovozyma dairenensis CBS 421]CCD24234.1 hypothetical protein NDAI_0C05750 [Naumovozyma dairenensis CBS 421]
MSFRKRGEVLNGREPTSRTIPGREPLNNARRIPGTAAAANGRAPVIRSVRGGQTIPPTARMANLNMGTPQPGHTIPKEVASEDEEEEEALDYINHPGIRPSPVSANLVTSTGSEDLDKVLTHLGLPLGNSILVQEQGTTEFNSILCKLFAAQGIVHNRLDTVPGSKSGNTHLIVLSLNQGFAKELPGVYKGSRKDVKKSMISEEQSKLSVQNLNEQKATPQRYKDFKIAWKYKFADEKKAGKDISNNETEYKGYNHQFDVTSRMIPAPNSSDITFISPIQPLQNVITQVERTIKTHDHKLIRIIIPSLLHPAMYPPKMFNLNGIIALLHGLRSIVKKFESRCVLMGTISSDFVTPLLLVQIENLFDSSIKLEPFPQEMLQFLENVYKAQPNKVQHGLLHVLKLPIFSERGEMRVAKSEWAFRNGRKRFEIEEWSIPVDDADDDSNKKNEQSMNRPEDDPSSKAKKSTKISLEY